MTEKTEKATPYKLKKAKEQGQVSKSQELISCVFLLVLLTVSIVLWPSFLTNIKALCRQLLNINARLLFSIDSTSHLQHLLLLKITFLWLPFALAGLLAVAIATIAQTGFVWSGKPLSPDFKRISLSQGYKRLFSSKILFETAKNSLKISLIVTLLYFSFRHELTAFLRLTQTPPADFPYFIMALLSKLVLQLLALLFAWSAIDKIYTRWKFAKDNRMSKQEIKDEYRQREGDPKIKSKIKQLQQQLRQKTASLENVKTADVVITNPTHLAVVLKYDRGVMPAPKVVCKARGELVKQVKELAVRHHIPIIENKLFARALFATVDLNQWINREHFPIAAMILREIYQQKAAS